MKKIVWQKKLVMKSFCDTNKFWWKKNWYKKEILWNFYVMKTKFCEEEKNVGEKNLWWRKKVVTKKKIAMKKFLW